MSDIYKGELQDYEGNTIYPHSEADVIFCTDGETAQTKLNKYEEALGKVTGVTDSPEVDDSKILVSAKALHEVNSSLMDLGGFKPVIDESTGEITGYKTKAGADTVFPFRGGFNGADIYMSGTNLGNLSKTELASKGQYFYGFEYDDSAKKFTVLYDGTYSYMLSTTSSYTSLYINDKLIEYATHNGQATIYNTIELKKGDTGYIISNNAGQFAQGYLRRIA